MKSKVNTALRIILPFFICLIVVFCSVVPASAASEKYGFIGGNYVFNQYLETPVSSFAADFRFISAGKSFDHLIFLSAGAQANFAYDALYFNDTLVCYWINGVADWVDLDYLYFTIPDSTIFLNEYSVFDWLFWNSRFIDSSTGSDNNFTDEQIGSIIDKVEQNEADINSIQDAYGNLPLPNINPDDYSISLWLESEYQAFVSCLSVFWQNSLIMNMVAILGALLLVSFLVFGSK